MTNLSGPDCQNGTGGETASAALVSAPQSEYRGPLAPSDLGALGMRSTGTRRASRKAAMSALQATGAFETVEGARAALWKLTAADWVEAIWIGVRRRDRTAMRLFPEACRMLGQEGAILQAFLAQFGLASIDAMRAILDQAHGAKDSPPEQTDRDCIEWLEARGYRVARQAQAVEQGSAARGKA